MAGFLLFPTIGCVPYKQRIGPYQNILKANHLAGKARVPGRPGRRR